MEGLFFDFDDFDEWIKQILYFIGCVFLSLLVLTFKMIILEKQYTSSFELVISTMLFFGLLFLIGWIIWTKLSRFLVLATILIFVGMLLDKPNIIMFSIHFIIVCVIIQLIWVIGDMIDNHKKKKKRLKK